MEKPGSEIYADVVATYIRVIKQDSPDAAAVVEEIVSTCGSHAGLRATLVLTLIKMEAQKRQADQNIRFHMYLIKDFPEALPLLERAVTICLQVWAAPPPEPPGSAGAGSTSAAEEPTSPMPPLPPL